MLSLIRSAVKSQLEKPAPANLPNTVLATSLRPENSVQEFDYVTINNPTTINRILNQMHYSHSKVSIHVEVADKVNGNSSVCSFDSSIARVSRKDNQLIIHQLSPKGWQKVIKPGQLVEVNCFMPSGQLSFFSHLSPLDETRENYYCILSMPKEVSKFQLRSAFRVFMPPQTCRIGVTLKDADGKYVDFEGVGLDLSLEGCCLRFIGDVFPLLEEARIFRNLQFNILSGALNFTTDAKICRLSSGQGGQTIAGVRFLPLPDSVKKRLQTALVDVQRIQLRQQVQIY